MRLTTRLALLVPSIVCAHVVSPGDAATLTPSADPLAPKVFHAPVQARGGDIVPIQGAHFTSATAYYVSGTGSPVGLQVVDRVGDVWLSLKLPTQLPTPVAIYLQNSHGSSSLLPLNAAVPKHLDATVLVPGGSFRIFGVNLLVGSANPVVTVGGLSAIVNRAASTANMLVVNAPASLSASSGATVSVDNGSGSGPSTLPTTVQVMAGSGDPLKLGVGWGAGFTFTGNVVTAYPACNGTTDDTWAIESAIVQAAKAGGGIVQLPSGTCRIASTVNLASRVVLKGKGLSSTILRYEGNYPIYAEGFDLVGLSDLQVLNAGSTVEGVIWKNNTRSFIERVALNMGVSHQYFLTANQNFVFDGNTVTQTGSYDYQNPYRFDNSSGLVFSNNHTTNAQGSPTFQAVHDAAFLTNHFTRDAKSQNENPVVAHHGFVADFDYRVSLIGNTFDVVNGPVTNKLRNDGETFLVEGGGSNRTESTGTVASASSTTLYDPKNSINVDPFGTGSIPANYGVGIVSGTGAGQRRQVVAYANATLTVDHAWDVLPDATSRYATFVWGLKDALLLNNTLTDNPRGIWLYQCSVASVVITGNTISQGGGIFLRSYQNASQKLFTVQDDVVVSDNRITNTTGLWMSYVDIANVSSDTSAIGTGEINIESRRNSVAANPHNVTSSTEDYADREGFTALLHIEPGGGQINAAIPNMLGTVFQANVCQNCSQPIVIGTGDFGTTVVGNTPGVATSGSVTDETLLGSQYGASTSTLKY